MPPRLRPSNLPVSFSPSPSIRPRSIAQPARTARDFSQSSSLQVTKRRRKFYEWLNGPGRALKQPLPGTTNYLGAYDRFGNLIRRGAQREDRKDKEAAEDKKKSGEDGEEGDKEKPAEGQESPDDLEEARRVESRLNQAEKPSKNNLPPETLDDLRPFPLNRFFRSQSVLSEELREAIWRFVVRDGKTVPLASITFGVSNERVGAVVRLKQMEKEWIAQGKTMAMPYAKAVLDMLPVTPYVKPGSGRRPVIHEPINDLIVHPATRQQLFVPVAESRHFTREDAGKAFDNDLLPADERIPHPELVKIHRDEASGYNNEERRIRAQERYAEAFEKKKKAEDAKQRDELKNKHTFPGRRWDFVIRDVSVDHAGRTGRDPRGVGWRYGLPHQDRKKGQVKIPTSVEA